jgi:histone H3/H4
MFERYIEAIQKTGDYLLAWQFQKEQMKARLLDNAEIDRIAERVLERISIRIEAEAIEQLRNMLNSLGE